ncbi:hypothetical protein HKD37_05G013286 [Glycine soja]
MVLEGQPIVGHAKHSQEYLAWYQSNTIIFLYMQSPSEASMNFKTGQSSRETNIMQPECNPTYKPIPRMKNYVPPTYRPIPPMTDYVPPSLSNMDYTPSIIQLDEFLSNVFGTTCGTPASTREYMHSLQNEVGNFTPPSFILMFSQDVEENNPSLHDILDQPLR